MRGAGLGLRARARMYCVRLHACMCRPVCSPCTYARMQSCMLLAARMCVLGGVHTCMSECTVTACTCAWGCGLAVHGKCVCACECVGSRACTPPTRTHATPREPPLGLWARILSRGHPNSEGGWTGNAEEFFFIFWSPELLDDCGPSAMRCHSSSLRGEDFHV